MIETIKNRDGYIVAYIEANVLGPDGQFKDDGEYVYVNHVWIHPKERKRKTLRHLIDLLHKNKFTQESKWVYWEREKYNHRMSKIHSIEKITKGDNHGRIKKFTTSSSC